MTFPKHDLLDWLFNSLFEQNMQQKMSLRYHETQAREL